MQITKDLKFEDITIKKYNSIVEKHLIAIKIIDSCIKEDANGINLIDYFHKYLATQMSLISNYTDLEFSEEPINDFDCLAEMGLIEKIVDSIPDSEVNFIVDLVDSELDQIVKIGNSLERILAINLRKVVDKIPNNKELKSLSKSLVKDINKMDWDKIPMLKQMWQTANFRQGDGDGK